MHVCIHSHTRHSHTVECSSVNFHHCQTQDVKQVLKTDNALTNTQREVITGITRDLSAALNVNNTLSVLPRDLTTTTNLVGELARCVCEGVKTLTPHVIQTVYQIEHACECTYVHVHVVCTYIKYRSTYHIMYILCIHFMEICTFCIIIVYTYISSVCIH